MTDNKSTVKFTYKGTHYVMDSSKNLYKVNHDGVVDERPLPQHPVFLNVRLAGEKQFLVS